MTSLRTRIAITASSSRGVAGALADAVDGALDLAGTGAHAGRSEFATAMPRSSWQCTENMAWSEFGTRSRTILISAKYSSGTV